MQRNEVQEFGDRERVNEAFNEGLTSTLTDSLIDR
jgi:hypothetical protein